MRISLLFFLILFISCKPKSLIAQSLSQDKIIIKNEVFVSDSTFVALKDYSNEFVYDMKYATNNNFLHQSVYDCPECYIRLITVKKLIQANHDFLSLGYRIKLYDCYRPLDVQKKMWQIVSNPEYVADPKKGSIHNRGGAVDITLVDKDGNELNMGTSFDFFGAEAGHNYQNLSDEVKQNRKMLKEIMLKNGFASFDSEWWHYNAIGGNTFELANFKWNCE